MFVEHQILYNPGWLVVILLPLSLPSPSPLSGTPERDLPPALDEMDLPTDLFSVLFKCQSHESPWRSLLAHAIALQRPLLAILAACYEVCPSNIVSHPKGGCVAINCVEDL